jgi:hypothetical protein
MMVWKSGKLQSHKIEDLCLILSYLYSMVTLTIRKCNELNHVTVHKLT